MEEPIIPHELVELIILETHPSYLYTHIQVCKGWYSKIKSMRHELYTHWVCSIPLVQLKQQLPGLKLSHLFRDAGIVRPVVEFPTSHDYRSCMNALRQGYSEEDCIVLYDKSYKSEHNEVLAQYQSVVLAWKKKYMKLLDLMKSDGCLSTSMFAKCLYADLCGEELPDFPVGLESSEIMCDIGELHWESVYDYACIFLLFAEPYQVTGFGDGVNYSGAEWLLSKYARIGILCRKYLHPDELTSLCDQFNIVLRNVDHRPGIGYIDRIRFSQERDSNFPCESLIDYHERLTILTYRPQLLLPYSVPSGTKAPPTLNPYYERVHITHDGLMAELP